MNSRVGRTTVCIVTAVLVSVAGWAQAATPQQVNDAISKAIKFQYSRQKNGCWDGPRTGEGKHETNGWQWGGITALVTYSLLAAEEGNQKPEIKQAIEFLKQANMIGTYAVAMRAQIWTFLPRQEQNWRAAVERDAKILVGMNLNGPGQHVGMFHYGPTDGTYDHSCSNYGVLGVWAVARCGFEVPGRVWQAMDAGWRQRQNPDGGWSYVAGSGHGPGGGNSTMSMTSAAVATLFITQDFIHAAEGVKCEGNIVDINIERGIEWMSKNFNKFQEGQAYYSLYNIERVGVAGGYKYFGTVDWYKLGADWLISRQKPDGSWDGNPIHTAWATLFLVRGRAPVMINKLAYVVNTAGDKNRKPTWNERSRDAANITNYVAALRERPLNWQIVNLQVPMNELHDSPILYIAGKEALNFTKDEEAKLRQFVEEGGLIVGNADCGSLSFANSFKKLGNKLFGQEFRELPDSHSIYTGQQFQKKKWTHRFSLMGLSNGARELMLLFPNADPARGWQVQAFSGNERSALAECMANIFFYMISRENLRYKGETFVVQRDKAAASKSVSIARLQYPGNWDPEPGGWRRLGDIMHNQHKTDLKVETVKLGEGKLSSTYKVAHLTGTSKLTLTATAKAELKKYIEGGGTLVVDAAGGAAEFGLAAEKELRDILGETAKLGVLAANHPVYAAGNKIEEVEYRKAAYKLLGRNWTPRLRGEEHGSRVAVFFSAEDLSVGLVGNLVDDIVGYNPTPVKVGNRTRAGASEIMSNIILYAAK